jgi:L-alanine-DL-glutamate epimerase-like enolase superfamily enzyme
MAVWDATAKIAGVPLHRFLTQTVKSDHAVTTVRAYASGGYLYPSGDAARLAEEARSLLAHGYANVKIKIGAAPLEQDLARIETVLALLPPGCELAVDAMNQYDAARCAETASALAPYGLWWFEDICNPLDFETQAAIARTYEGKIAVGEALFSADEAKLVDSFGGLRRDRDVLQFDPAHCYGVPEFLRIVQTMEQRGWPRDAFWPHGGHLYTLHLVAALGLGGCEMNPQSFQPFGGSLTVHPPRMAASRLPTRPGSDSRPRPNCTSFTATCPLRFR